MILIRNDKVCVLVIWQVRKSILKFNVRSVRILEFCNYPSNLMDWSFWSFAWVRVSSLS